MAAAPAARPQPLLTGAFVALVGSELAYFTAQGVLLPVVPVFVIDRLDAGVATVGVVVAALSVTALVLRPLAGRASDRWGPGPLLLAGSAVVALAAAAHVTVESLGQLVVLRVALGAAEAGYAVAAVAVLSQLAPPGRRGQALSYSSLGLYLGIAVGPALGELLLRRGGFDTVWTAVAVLGLVAGLLAWPLRARPEPAPTATVTTSANKTETATATATATATGAETESETHDAGTAARTRGTAVGHGLRPLVVPALALTVGVAAAAGFMAFAALHARTVGLDGAGTVLLVYGAVVVVTRLSLAGLVDRGAATRWATAALLLGAAGLAVMAASPSRPGLYAGTVLLAVGVALLTPAVYRLMVEGAPGAAHGSVAAVFTIALDVGLGLGPVSFGLLAAGGGTSAGLAGGAALALVGSIAVAAAARRTGRP